MSQFNKGWAGKCQDIHCSLSGKRLKCVFRGKDCQDRDLCSYLNKLYPQTHTHTHQMWPASFASCSEVCEGLTYFLNAKPLGCFAGLCGCNAWKLNVRLQHSLLVAFHYKPEADHRLSLGDLRQKKKTSQAGLQPLEVAVEQRRKKWNAAMKKNLSPYTLQCMSYSCAEIACGREIVACIMISSPSYSPPVIQSCFPLSLSLSLISSHT